MDPLSSDFILIDRLAHEYGWSIEYIEELGIGEISNLCRAIDARKKLEDRMSSYIATLAVCGKTLDSVGENSDTPNDPSPEESKTRTKQDESQMLQLFQRMGMDPSDTVKGMKKKKLEM